MADYMITLKNSKTGRIRYVKNCIGANCIFSNYENALAVFNSQCRYAENVSEIKLLRIEENKDDVEVRVFRRYEEDENGVH